MSYIKGKFIISRSLGCPLYKVGDCFTLCKVALTAPPEKPSCLVLSKDILEIASEFSKNIFSIEGRKTKNRTEFNCSGCRGVVKYKYVADGGYQSFHMLMEASYEEKNCTSN